MRLTVSVMFLFQSTPPHEGATRGYVTAAELDTIFQSTPPHEGATSLLTRSDTARSISIHAPS